MSVLETQQRRRIEELDNQLSDWKSAYTDLRNQHHRRVTKLEADIRLAVEQINALKAENAELKDQLARRYAPAAIIDA